MESLFPLQHLQKWKATLLAVFFLTCFAAVASYEFKQLSEDPRPVFRLDTPIGEKIQLLGEHDAGRYLSVGRRFADMGEISEPCRDCNPPSSPPFVHWGPGTPFFIGLVLRVTHSTNLIPYFFAVVALEAMTAFAILWMVSLVTLSLPALLLTTFFAAWCPPVQSFFYSNALTCSEPLALFFLAWAFLSIALGFRALWRKKFHAKILVSCFGMGGFMLGFASLVRDSYIQYSAFFAVAAICLVILRDRKKFKAVLIAALVLYTCAQAVRVPVKVWNKKRMGNALVASSSALAIWRDGIWADNSSFTSPALRAWADEAGLGVGTAVDPESAMKVRAAWNDKNAAAGPLSRKLFVKMLVTHPLDFLMFRARRMPVLWLGTRPMPFSSLDLVSGWSMAFYLCFFLYLGNCMIRRKWPLEMVYLPPIFLLLASMLIHNEFRYSFPNWITLRILPGLLLVEFLGYINVSASATPSATIQTMGEIQK